MPESDLIPPPLERKDPAVVDPEDRDVNEPGPFVVPIERPLSGVRARMFGRPTLHLALATAVPAYKLTVLAVAAVVTFVLFGLVPAALVLAALLLGELILRVVRRARAKAGIGQAPSLPPKTPRHRR